MNFLDSASIRYGDSFIAVMQKPGAHRYAIVPAHGARMAFEFPFEVVVSERRVLESDEQSEISVGFEDGRFTAKTARISVPLGGAVGWSSEKQDTPGFAIIAEHERFGSDPLRGRVAFSHRFSAAGEYVWVDRYGGRTTGKISVSCPDDGDDAAMRRWQEQIQQAVLIEVPGGGNQRAVIGQPVIFLMDDARGISITDANCIAANKLEEAHASARAAPAKDRRG